MLHVYFTTDYTLWTVHDLALTRSGDKGNSCNVSVIARKPEYLPYLRRHLTEERIFEFFRHKFPQDATAELVTRYDWPGINGLNFVLEQSLGTFSYLYSLYTVLAGTKGKCVG